MSHQNISEDSKKSCDVKITSGECLSILNKMPLNKSPGNDGLTVEFYRIFWPDFGHLVLDSFNASFEKGELSSTQRQGVITVIKKEEKDALYIRNYRPITLLNVDYKLLSKVLAERIKLVLGEVIYVDQVGFLPDRNIGEAVRIIDDIIFYTKEYNVQGYLVAVDFEKAFDSVSHSYMKCLMRKYGFGPYFCRWIEVIYNNAVSCVMNGGFSTGYFEIGRGLK